MGMENMALFSSAPFDVFNPFISSAPNDQLSDPDGAERNRDSSLASGWIKAALPGMNQS